MNNTKELSKIKIFKEKVENLKLIIVDDEIAILKSTEKFFKKFFEKVTTVQTATDALEILSKHNDYDIIITDLKMPYMDGTELINKIKENPNYRDLFIVIISGTTKDNQKTTNLSDFYIQKPVNLQNIIEMLDKLITKKEL